MKYIFLAAFILLAIPSTIHAQNSKKEAKELQKEAEYQSLQQLIDTEQYSFRGNKANPQKGPQIDLTTRENFLKIQDGNAAADMPYFGRAYSGGYSSGDGGINFDGPMESYDVSKNDKKRRVTIKFVVKGEGDSFTCTLTVSGLNNATLSVISVKRQSISYIGTISELE